MRNVGYKVAAFKSKEGIQHLQNLNQSLNHVGTGRDGAPIDWLFISVCTQILII